MIGPARLMQVKANLIWRADGSIWAGWKVLEETFSQAIDGDESQQLRTLRAFLATIDTPTQLLGIANRVSTRDLAERCVTGVNEAHRDRWRRMAIADAGWIMAKRPIVRSSYVFAQIQSPQPLAQFRVTTNPKRVSQELKTLYQRMAIGLAIAPLTPPEIYALEGRVAGINATAPLGEIRAFEGGQPHERVGLQDRQIVKIQHNNNVFWQATGMLSFMPAQFLSPGLAAWFQAADTVNHPMDWAAFITPIPNAQARRRCAQQRRQLAGQEDEYAGDPAGAPPELQAALEALDREQRELQANPSEPALLLSMGWTVRHAQPGEVLAAFDQLKANLEPQGFGIDRPTGGQLDGLVSLCPGVREPITFGHYTQHLLPPDIAAGLPLSPVGVGDGQGIPIGIAPRGYQGACTAVFLDPSLGPATNRSGSLAVFGALGSGKSYFIKRMILGSLARGHRVSVLDRTIHGEYVQLAGVSGVSTRVVSLEEDQGLDPLRCLPGPAGEELATAVLSIIARVPPAEADGIRLAHAVHQVALQGGGLGDVPTYLAHDSETVHLAQRIDVMLRQPLAKVLVGTPDVSLNDVDYLCFHAPGLSLPDRDSTIHAHLAQEVLPAQIIGRAVVHLVTAMSHYAIMRNRERFGVHVVDEAWALTSSPAGLAMLLDAVRDGRKHNAALWLLSQDPADIGDDALARLMGTRVVFRCDEGALDKASDLLAIPRSQLADIPDLPTGSCVIRDLAGRVSRVDIGRAGDPAIHRALNTTPLGE
ncbi:ATP-binding protein [Stomatohabitans albus]|uniref:ATP-binding protein n=1 Tax=Stomatohabitans albus TaxID=3110766 RepID=UPI00300D5D47